MNGSLVTVCSVVFSVIKLCYWPVTPALLCCPSCSFSSPLPQYDSRWLTMIGLPLYHCHRYFVTSGDIMPSPLCPLITSVFALLTHQLCHYKPDIKWFGFFGFIPFVWRKSLWVSNWSEWLYIARSSRMWRGRVLWLQLDLNDLTFLTSEFCPLTGQSLQIQVQQSAASYIQPCSRLMYYTHRPV